MTAKRYWGYKDLFRLCATVPNAPPVSEHVILHSKSLCITMARDSGVQTMCNH